MAAVIRGLPEHYVQWALSADPRVRYVRLARDPVRGRVTVRVSGRWHLKAPRSAVEAVRKVMAREAPTGVQVRVVTGWPWERA